MAPKAGRRGTKRKAEVQTEEDKPSVEEKKDRGEEENGQDGQRVVIEHWRNAEEVKSALLAAHPELTVVFNPEKPRRNSFEITLLDGGKETSLWTGIKKGPPRKLKFPQPDVVVAALQEALKAE
ncbi:selenoprotein H isoform X2 [Sebastes umbrosus]|uniref:selenoprotein H isoform X2 n=1 Tax=Sebastes umbrosus TaxID=72105 RepID=UPI00189E6019|nr:selenoprotein H isoform X2 [Sebastes umbrosus]